MTILSFKPKGRGGGRGASERHIVFKLKAQLLFPRQVSLPPPRARGRQPSDGIVIHQGPVTAAEGLTPPSPGTARLGSALHPAKVTPPRRPRQLLLPRAPQHPPLLSPLLIPPFSLGLDRSLPSSHWFSSLLLAILPLCLGHQSSSPQRQAGDADVTFLGEG